MYWRAPCLLLGEPWGKCDHLTNTLDLQEVTSCRKLLLKEKFSLGLFRPDSFNDALLNVSLKDVANAFMTGNYILKIKKNNKNLPELPCYGSKTSKFLAVLVLAAPAMFTDHLPLGDTSMCQQTLPLCLWPADKQLATFSETGRTWTLLYALKLHGCVFRNKKLRKFLE